MTKAGSRFDNKKRRRPENHDRQRMLTPAYILEPIRNLLGGIGLDPCTEADNPTGADEFYSPPNDGCDFAWNAYPIFVNPPYGEAKDRWVKRCIEVAAVPEALEPYKDGLLLIPAKKIVLLIPSHTETRIFQEALTACDTALFVRARLRFGVKRSNGRQEAASHGSALFGFNVDLSPMAPEFGVAMKRT